MGRKRNRPSKRANRGRLHLVIRANLLPYHLFHAKQSAGSSRRANEGSVQLPLGILKNKKCHLHQLGGVEDHIHILTSIHSTVCLADLIRDLKTSSTSWIRQNKVFRDFPGWQNEYGAFTKSHSDRDGVTAYIRNQAEHHRTESFVDELRRLLKEEGIAFEERYLL